ncbi:hypothetical protein PoB_006453000 [Plakobranchus ocellatus]|uniref:Uncharacterized protein n=1 Tax=Plakobranchus ocellatus TaxID=259542 RepID=A0AAV4D1Y5_9GAST|nr:hypothetical protein PoB_006453000 [Plakobranchus ocellatus]
MPTNGQSFLWNSVLLGNLKQALVSLCVPGLYKKITSGLQAPRLVRVPVAGLEAKTKKSVQISWRIRYQLSNKCSSAGRTQEMICAGEENKWRRNKKQHAEESCMFVTREKKRRHEAFRMEGA